MNQTFINTLPLIIAEEKEALLTSVLNMLRQKGFVVIQQASKSYTGPMTPAVKRLDGLNLLRYVTQNWPKGAPVVIQETDIIEAGFSLRKTAA